MNSERKLRMLGVAFSFILVPLCVAMAYFTYDPGLPEENYSDLLVFMLLFLGLMPWLIVENIIALRKVSQRIREKKFR